MNASHTENHLASVVGIFGGVTEFLSGTHLGTALLVGVASGAGVKLGGWLISTIIQGLKRERNQDAKERRADDRAEDKQVAADAKRDYASNGSYAKKDDNDHE